MLLCLCFIKIHFHLYIFSAADPPCHALYLAIYCLHYQKLANIILTHPLLTSFFLLLIKPPGILFPPRKQKYGNFVSLSRISNSGKSPEDPQAFFVRLFVCLFFVKVLITVFSAKVR